MKSITYIAGLVILAVIIAVVYITMLNMKTASSNSSTLNTSTPTTIYQSTTVPLSNNSIVSVSQYGCTAAKYFTCKNATYSNSASNVSYINVSVGQDTGQLWSSFGIGYAPQGTAISGGIPHIRFYTPNDSANNVGPSLASGSSVNARIPVNGTATSTTGTIWACYVNSGILYIGNGCTTSGGAPATYVAIGTVNLIT
jgi:hypothetical protein